MSVNATTTVETARFAACIGASPQLVYRKHAEAPEELPVQPIALGRRLRWPVAEIARVTGLPPQFVAHGCLDEIDALAAALASSTGDAGSPDAPDAA